MFVIHTDKNVSSTLGTNCSAIVNGQTFYLLNVHIVDSKLPQMGTSFTDV